MKLKKEYRLIVDGEVVEVFKNVNAALKWARKIEEEGGLRPKIETVIDNIGKHGLIVP